MGGGKPRVSLLGYGEFSSGSGCIRVLVGAEEIETEKWVWGRVFRSVRVDRRGGRGEECCRRGHGLWWTMVGIGEGGGRGQLGSPVGLLVWVEGVVVIPRNFVYLI